jgi:DNA-binding GntR family transcriptional regulator
MHRRMLEFTGRARVWAQIEASKLHFDRVRWLLLERVTEHAERAFREHKAIIRRLAARDATGLVKAMHQHIEAVANHLLELRDRAPDGYLTD